MKNMFESCETLTNVEVSGFITSNVTNMSYNILSLSSKLISTHKYRSNIQWLSIITVLDKKFFNFDKNVININFIFYGCNSLTFLNLYDCINPKLVNMNSTFHDCSALRQLNINNFDISKVKNINYLFYNSNSLTSINFDIYGIYIL